MLNQPATDAGLELRLRMLRILWAAFLVCVGLFFLVTRFTRPTDLPTEVSGGLSPLLYVLAVVALILVVASFALKGIFYKRAAEHQQPMLTQAGFTLAMALCESGVLLGMVGIFVTRNDAAYLIFALGALGMLLHFPRREQVEAAFYNSTR